jgi:hypothetical protein
LEPAEIPGEIIRRWCDSFCNHSFSDTESLRGYGANDASGFQFLG